MLLSFSRAKADTRRVIWHLGTYMLRCMECSAVAALQCCGLAELYRQPQVWGAYTFNSEDNSANRTFVNIKEREGFIIEPFTASIANSAVAIRCSC